MNQPSLVVKMRVTGLVIGNCVHVEGKGWRFIPANAARKPSRKDWPTAYAAIPKWARKLAASES